MRCQRWTIIPILTLLLISSGCAIFPKKWTAPVIDPFVERNRLWQQHVEQGNRELERKNLRAAIAAYQTALTLRPESSEVQRKIAEIYFQLEEYENALAAFIAFLELEPNNITALNYAGYISEHLQDYAAAATYYERVLTVSVDNLYALNHLGLAYKQLQRGDDALEVLHTALSLDPKCERPESENLHNYLGLIYLDRGDIGEAIAEFRVSIRLFPESIWAREQLATLYENQERYFEAQLQYQQILDIAPDNLLALTRLQALAQQNLGPTASVAVPPVTLLAPDVDRIIAEAPDASDYPHADTLVLFNHFSHDILPTGQSRYTTHQVIKILTERGIQHYGDIAIPYQPATQNIGVNIARTITADGRTLYPPDEAFNDATPPGLLAQNLYSDGMWKVISMVGLAPGACIEYQVTLEDKVPGGETWITGGYNFQATEATLATRYALQIPEAWHLQWQIANDPLNRTLKNPAVTHTENDTRIYVWQSGETPALTVEAGMPHINNVAPRLRYSSIRDWNAVYTWYHGLAKGQYAPDTEIQNKVRELTKTLTTEAEKVRAIYHFVATHIRYVGIELGQSAYQPTPAAEVFRVQYGDCKDKTTLLISMLDLAGIKAYPVLMSLSPYERVDTTLPSLTPFNHMIAAVPTGRDTYTWLDPTSSTCRYGDLPYNAQGRTGFLISETDAEFVETPIFPPEANRLISTTDLTLDSRGTVTGTLHIQTSGQYDLTTRWAYQQINPDALQPALAAELSDQFPGIQITRHEVSGLYDLNTPVTLKLGFRVENYATPLNNGLLLPLPIDEFGDYAETFASDRRRYSLDFGYPTHIEKTIRIQVPEGWHARLPADAQHHTEIAEFTRQYRQVENVVTYQLRFTLKNRVLPAEMYPAVKPLFIALASEDGSRLLLNRDIYDHQRSGVGNPAYKRLLLNRDIYDRMSKQ